jgi:hypothetical protein
MEEEGQSDLNFLAVAWAWLKWSLSPDVFFKI